MGTATTISCTPGNRRVRLDWQAPVESANTPVRRYVVAVFDPTYGRALTIATLEPDYDESQHRFVPIEELRSFVLAEQELKKMPRLFQQPMITFQVAAANETGQSAWTTLQAPSPIGSVQLPQKKSVNWVYLHGLYNARH